MQAAQFLAQADQFVLVALMLAAQDLPQQRPGRDSLKIRHISA